MTAQLPKRHHYVPEFYLRSWANAEGMLHRYAIENGKVRLRLRPPKSIGHGHNLYRAPHEHLTESQAQALETDFFRPIDSDAAKAMARLLAGDLALDGWPPAERTAWVLFVRSLMLRSPRRIAEARKQLREIFEATLKGLEAEYEQRRSSGDPSTFEEFRASLHPEHPERAVLPSIAHVIGNEKIGQKVLNAQWAVVDVAPARHTLLASDVKPGHIGLDLANGHIMLPISPTKLFVAATDPRFLDHLRRISENDLVQAMNQRTVGEASRFVVACDDRQSVFISNRFGRDSERPAPVHP